MADRWALLIGVEKFLHPALGALPYVETGLRGFAEALAGAGVPAARQLLLVGSHATRAVAESRLKKWAASHGSGDEVMCYFATRGFSSEGAGSLALWDTQPDDLAATSLSVARLFELLHTSRAAAVVALLDVAGGLDLSEARAFEQGLDDAELQALAEASPQVVALTAAGDGGESHAAAPLKATLWTHVLTEALAGRLPKALDAAGAVTALTLARTAEAELPRLLRKHFDTVTEQAPQLFGAQNAAAVVADLSARLGQSGPGALLDPERLKRVVFRTESHGRVRELTGFRKNFQVPDAATPSSKKFIARLADADVKTDLDAVVEQAREHLSYKRKDVELIADGDGVGTVRTPDFEYSVRGELDREDPSRVVWRREVGAFTNPGFVRSAGFEAVFGKLFDQLVLEFAQPVDVEALIDRLEDSPPKGVKIQVTNNGAACEISLAGFTGRVIVERLALTIRGRAGHSAGLLDQFLAFFQAVGPLGEPLRLG